jgi:methylmalonyl-CoA mutase cobalamin-binding domain/chain
VGGIIPPKDVEYLLSLGADAVFGPGSDTRKIVETIKTAMKKKRGTKSLPSSPK